MRASAARRCSASCRQIDQALTLLEGLKEQYPPFSGRFTIAEGEGGCIQLRPQPGSPASLYNKALTDDPDDLDLLYSQAALVLEELSRLNDSEDDLRKILKKTPEDSLHAQCALGYMLGVHTQRRHRRSALAGRAGAQDHP